MAVDVEALYKRYGPMVMRRCRQLLGHEQQALDAMQDTFVQVLRNRDKLDERACSSLLYRIATNTCLNRLRSRRRRPEDAQSELLQHIAGTLAEEGRSEARSLLARLFAGEAESTATIAVLHLHDGFTLEEVAAEVGMSVSGVRKRLRKLRRALHDVDLEPLSAGGSEMPTSTKKLLV